MFPYFLFLHRQMSQFDEVSSVISSELQVDKGKLVELFTGFNRTLANHVKKELEWKNPNSKVLKEWSLLHKVAVMGYMFKYYPGVVGVSANLTTGELTKMMIGQIGALLMHYTRYSRSMEIAGLTTLAVRHLPHSIRV